MNLEDVLDPDYGLIQDNWSIGKPKFGEDGQLEVIGWGARDKAGTKLYILKRSICAQDFDLHRQGVFRSSKGSLVNGQIPCGCTISPRWSPEQFETLCVRKALSMGFTFNAFVGEWKGAKTKISMSCHKHGVWVSGTVNKLISSGRGCPGCQVDARTKPDITMTTSFLASGAFHPDTEFWRSGRLNSKGYPIYWYLHCPECGEIKDSVSSSLQQGCRPCSCSIHRQQEAYINWLVDDHNNAVALKFGIARDSKQRIKNQDRNSIYGVRQYQVFTFPDVSSCKAAERECKKELVCGVVSKTDMVDGYTETTSVLNLNKVRVIYEKWGGVLNE